MALSLRLRLPWRRRRIAPMPMPQRRPADTRMRGVRDPDDPVNDDYLVEGSESANQPSATLQTVQFLQVILILFMAVLSFGVFWILAVMFNII